MICASVYLLVFIQNLLVHLAEKILLLQPLKFGGDYQTFYETVETLQADLDAWLVHYNTERPHLGYRNQGRRPIETVMSFVSQEG